MLLLIDDCLWGEKFINSLNFYSTRSSWVNKGFLLPSMSVIWSLGFLSFCNFAKFCPPFVENITSCIVRSVFSWLTKRSNKRIRSYWLKSSTLILSFDKFASFSSVSSKILASCSDLGILGPCLAAISSLIRRLTMSFLTSKTESTKSCSRSVFSIKLRTCLFYSALSNFFYFSMVKFRLLIFSV